MDKLTPERNLLNVISVVNAFLRQVILSYMDKLTPERSLLNVISVANVSVELCI